MALDIPKKLQAGHIAANIPLFLCALWIFILYFEGDVGRRLMDQKLSERHPETFRDLFNTNWKIFSDGRGKRMENKQNINK